MVIQVLIVEGQPTFEYSPLSAMDVDELVKLKYGCQPNGSLHNWRGVPSNQVTHYWDVSSMAYTSCKKLPNQVETTDDEEKVTCPECLMRLSGQKGELNEF